MVGVNRPYFFAISLLRGQLFDVHVFTACQWNCGNVTFSVECVCQSVSLWDVPMWPLSMMPWVSHRSLEDPSSISSSLLKCGPPTVPSPSPNPLTCSNLFNLELTVQGPSPSIRPAGERAVGLPLKGLIVLSCFLLNFNYHREWSL